MTETGQNQAVAAAAVTAPETTIPAASTPAAVAAPAEAASNAYKLDNFELGVTLGTGTFGRVRFATFKENKDRVCAIKMLKKADVINLQQVEHIIAEKDILEAISKGKDGMESHPFIVNLFGTFQDDTYLYMILEYVNGGEFFTHLRREGRLDNNRAKFYAASVVLIFQHLHKVDVIYRDLKPENLLLDHQGYLKITDFGFAKKVTFKTYTLCGTPEYIAPEVLLNKGHGKGVDWWTLGILMYEMLSGSPPFMDDDHMEIYHKILEGKVQFQKFFDRQSKALIKRMLCADLTKRYGCLKNGAKDIMNHKWFNGFKFEQLLKRELVPPIQPSVSGPDDTSNFDPYPDTVSQAVPYVNEPNPFQFFDSIVIPV